PALVVPPLPASAGCDIATAEFRSEETAEWRKSYPLDASGRVEISNINGKIDVQPADGNTLQVVAIKKAKGPSPEAAKAALERIQIVDDASAGHVRIETKVGRADGGMFNRGGLKVDYRVRVRAGAEVTIEPRISNGCINAYGLAIETIGDQSRRRLEGRLNGGGPRLEIEGTNGGITLNGR